VIEIDFGSKQLLSWLNLHRTYLSDSVPQTVPSDFGIPERLLVEGATQEDFSDAEVIADYRKKSVYDTGPIIARRFAETSCRYVRLIAVEPYLGDIWVILAGRELRRLDLLKSSYFPRLERMWQRGSPYKLTLSSSVA